MKPAYELLTAAHYTRVLRPLLPAEAFRPHHGQLWRAGFHLGIYGCGLMVLRQTGGAFWSGLLCSLIMGHSLACCAFIAHDISHGSVVRNRMARRALELLLWGLNAIPPTLWHVVHNQTHHAETNTLGDTDRRFLETEKSAAVELYTRLLLPGKGRTWAWFLIFCQFVAAYVLRHSSSAMNCGSTLVTAKPNYQPAQRFQIISEFLVILCLQLGVWAISDNSLALFLWASPVSLSVASAVAMMYIFTNHSLNPLCEHTDPVTGSTSVAVPSWMDWLHDNFSYHTEHHVFPGMNPRYFPQVSELLQNHFPERYNRIPLREAWHRLGQLEDFIPATPEATNR